MERQIKSLRAEIKELYKGTTAELKNEIVSYEEILAEKNQRIEEVSIEFLSKLLQRNKIHFLL